MDARSFLTNAVEGLRVVCQTKNPDCVRGALMIYTHFLDTMLRATGPDLSAQVEAYAANYRTLMALARCLDGVRDAMWKNNKDFAGMLGKEQNDLVASAMQILEKINPIRIAHGWPIPEGQEDLD